MLPNHPKESLIEGRLVSIVDARPEVDAVLSVRLALRVMSWNERRKGGGAKYDVSDGIRCVSHLHIDELMRQ